MSSLELKNQLILSGEYDTLTEVVKDIIDEQINIEDDESKVN